MFLSYHELSCLFVVENSQFINPVDFSLFDAKLLSHTVAHMILDSDRFYRPNRQPLRLYTSTGRRIYYPKHVLKKFGVDEGVHVKNRSFLHSHSVATTTTSSYHEVEDAARQSELKRVAYTTEKFLLFERQSLFGGDMRSYLIDLINSEYIADTNSSITFSPFSSYTFIFAIISELFGDGLLVSFFYNFLVFLFFVALFLFNLFCFLFLCMLSLTLCGSVPVIE